MRICIYGAGAVGLGLASCLIKADSDVDLIARSDTVKALRKSGLIRTGIFGRFHAQPQQFNCCCSLEKLNKKSYDLIIVCTKSFDSKEAAGDLAEHKQLLGDSGKIILFQNGWGNAEKFLTHFPPQQIYNARVITGFTRHQPNEVEITVHADAIHVGSLFNCELEHLAKLCDLVTTGGIPCRLTESIEKDLWAKMLYNCMLNPVGALLGVSYGKLAQADSTKRLMNKLAKEVYFVMSKAGYSTYWDCVEGFLKVFYSRLVPDTAEHKSSMLQDLMAGKKTEIDALNGAVIELATKHNIDTPYNRSVHQLLKFMEIGT